MMERRRDHHVGKAGYNGKATRSLFLCLCRHERSLQPFAQELDKALRFRGQQTGFGERVDRDRGAAPFGQDRAQPPSIQFIGDDFFRRNRRSITIAAAPEGRLLNLAPRTLA
jgi:hypothetical protein